MLNYARRHMANMPGAKRKARLRYERFLVSVAQNMTSDSRATLAELVDRG